MKFEQPEILFFLFLLLIPVIVHLFQLQKFKKVAFSNVKFLKEIEQQTRKSARLKKILILITRLLLLTSVILAFSKPYFPDKSVHIEKENFIYLDNSFSMGAKNEQGALFQNLKRELIENLPLLGNDITLITNSNTYKNSQDLKNNIINIPLSSVKKDLNTIILQINSIKKRNKTAIKNIYLLSDFQDNMIVKKPETDSASQYNLVQTLPAKRENISIDSVWIENNDINSIKIKSLIKSYQMEVRDLSVALQLNGQLYGKVSISITKDENKIIEFVVPVSENIQGELSLQDNRLLFDNTLYFNITKREKINVLAIGSNNEFLSKIYTDDEFVFTTVEEKNMNLNKLENQNLIILNELKFISNTLIISLKNHIQSGLKLVIIPSAKSDFASYNNLFSSLNLGQIAEKSEEKKYVTNISYNHPFFKHVFQKKVTNFQYPWVNQYFSFTKAQNNAILKFENNAYFLSEVNYYNSKIYLFSSPLNNQNSNFTKSPLVVPVFYNFSLQSASNQSLYYTIGNDNEIMVKSDTEENNVLHLSNSETDFIPLQTRTAQFVKIQTGEHPDKAGFYNITLNNNKIKALAFNYHRSESKLDYLNVKSVFKPNKNITYFTRLSQVFKQLNEQSKNNSLWHLFIIFALIFLIIEILLQRFIKN